MVSSCKGPEMTGDCSLLLAPGAHCPVIFPPSSGHRKEKGDGSISLGFGLCRQGAVEGRWGGGRGSRGAGGKEPIKKAGKRVQAERIGTCTPM